MSANADIYIAVGSNIDPERNIPAALRELVDAVDVVSISTFYRTRPLERPDQPDYRNGIFHVRAAMAPEEIERTVLKTIETALGRRRTDDKFAPRTIDLDLAAYRVQNGVPAAWTDPEVQSRNFVAVPLAEVAPELTSNETGATIAALADRLGHERMEPDLELTRRLKELLHP